MEDEIKMAEKDIIKDYKDKISKMTNEEFSKEWGSVINKLKEVKVKPIVECNPTKSSSGVSFGL